MAIKGFTEVSKERPCPTCKRDHFCLTHNSGKFGLCSKESAGSRKTTKGGMFVHVYESPLIGLPGPPVAPPANGKAVTLAPPEILNEVYKALLGRLTLNAHHINNLLNRGLTEAVIWAGLYKSHPGPGRRELARRLFERFGDKLLSVPGFAWTGDKTRRVLTINGLEGTLVPVRNLEGLIVALKIRRDGEGSGPKYTFLTGAKSGGVSPGAPPHAPLGTPLGAETVRITEGELKADGAFLLSGLPTLSFPGANSWHAVLPMLKAMGCKIVRVAFDSDAKEKKQVAFHLRACVRGLRQHGFVVELERWDVAYKGIDDLLHAGGKPEVVAGDDVDGAVTAICDQAGLEAKDEQESKSASTELVKQIMEEVEVWHTEDRQVYATAKSAPRWTYDIRSSDFEDWLTYIWFTRRGGSINSEALGSAKNTLRAQARFDGKRQTIATRVADRDGAGIAIDLGDEEWKAIVITSAGWEVQANHGIRFRRPKGHAQLTAPVAGGSIDQLREFVNVDNDRDWILLVAFILSCFRPSGPYPVLCLHGEKGSGKSTLTKIIRKLVDPSSMPLPSMPRSEHEFVIAASNSWVTSLDNLSYLPPWCSDALCRLSTGGGFRVRTLFENSEETLFQAERPAIINGIEELATRGDLLDRCLMLVLPAMKQSQRKANLRFWPRFEVALPGIIGALLDAVACGLKRIDSINLSELPRMADLACWITACEPALGWKRGTFLHCFRENAAEANQIAIEASPVARAIIKFMEDQDGSWFGTPAELLKALDTVAGDRAAARKGWPKEPNILSNRISRISQNLLDEGILVERRRGNGHDRQRLIVLTRQIEKSSSASSDKDLRAASAYGEMIYKIGRFADASSEPSDLSSDKQDQSQKGFTSKNPSSDDADDDFPKEEGGEVEL